MYSLRMKLEKGRYVLAVFDVLFMPLAAQSPLMATKQEITEAKQEEPSQARKKFKMIQRFTFGTSSRRIQ